MLLEVAVVLGREGRGGNRRRTEATGQRVGCWLKDLGLEDFGGP